MDHWRNTNKQTHTSYKQPQVIYELQCCWTLGGVTPNCAITRRLCKVVLVVVTILWMMWGRTLRFLLHNGTLGGADLWLHVLFSIRFRGEPQYTKWSLLWCAFLDLYTIPVSTCITKKDEVFKLNYSQNYKFISIFVWHFHSPSQLLKVIFLMNTKWKGVHKPVNTLYDSQVQQGMETQSTEGLEPMTAC